MYTADTSLVTADSTGWTADGALLRPSTGEKYAKLITNEHNKRAKFMAMVTGVCQAIGDVTYVADSLVAAFDLDTCVGAQEDIVGLWVGQSRVLPNILILGFFGFDDDPAALTFGELNDVSVGGIFYELNDPFSGTTVLNDDDYRTVLRARIIRNQSNGTIPAIEEALAFIFNVPSRIVDNGNRSIDIFVDAPITSTQKALLTQLDILPRPAGVAIGSITYST